MREAVVALAGSVCGSARGNVHRRMKGSLWEMCKKLIFKEILFFFPSGEGQKQKSLLIQRSKK